MRRRLLTTVGLLALLAAGCGGGDDPPAAEDSTEEATTTTTAGGDEDEDDADADAEDEAPAAPGAALALTRDDLGGPWKVHTPAVGTEAATEENCSRRNGGLVGLVDDGRYVGAILQRGEAVYFASSTVYSFADEAAALAEVELRRREGYQECRRAQLGIMGADGTTPEGATWRISNIGDAQGQGEGGFEHQLDFQYQATVDGTLQDGNGSFSVALFRTGSRLAEYTVQSVAGASDPPGTSTDGHAEYIAAIAKAQGRAQA